MDWIWIVRFEYLSLFIVIIGGAWFVLKLYPSVVFRLVTWFITILFSLAFVLTIFLPVKIFSYTILLYHPFILVLLGYVLFKSFLGIFKKNYIDLIYFLAFVMLLLGGLHDKRVSLGKADGFAGYMFTYIIVFFVFIQASLLLYKWVRAFREKEKLQNELEFMNRNLELLVNDRTIELQTRNEEIGQQNTRIALQFFQMCEYPDPPVW